MILSLSEQAERDLINIIDYTLDNWGYHQAEKYNHSFDDAFEAITENPFTSLSKDRTDLIPRMRSLKVEKHYLFYLVSETEVQVFRILHGSMDFGKHLKY